MDFRNGQLAPGTLVTGALRHVKPCVTIKSGTYVRYGLNGANHVIGLRLNHSS